MKNDNWTVEELEDELKTGNRLTAELTDKCRELEGKLEAAEKEIKELKSTCCGPCYLSLVSIHASAREALDAVMPVITNGINAIREWAELSNNTDALAGEKYSSLNYWMDKLEFSGGPVKDGKGNIIQERIELVIKAALSDVGAKEGG